jgi:type IV secretion system protein VirB1
MMLAPATVLALAARCAPAVAPTTLLALAQVESRLDPLAIGVNGGAGPVRPPQSRPEAIAAARARLADGANLDLGLAQINSANLARLGLSLEHAFDPCRNLAAAATLLREGYRLARADAPDDQSALRTGLSLYNTGHRTRGFRNGYVARVEASAARPIAGPPAAIADGRPAAVPAPPAAWDVFGEHGAAAFVIVPGRGARP